MELRLVCNAPVLSVMVARATSTLSVVESCCNTEAVRARSKACSRVWGLRSMTNFEIGGRRPETMVYMMSNGAFFR